MRSRINCVKTEPAPSLLLSSAYDSSNPPLIPFGVYGDPGGVPLPTLYNGGGGGGNVMQESHFCLSRPDRL